MGIQSDTLGVKPSTLDELFDSSTWKIKNIWDGVKLEIAAGDGCPVVLSSYTHLDPDLPILEEVTHSFNPERLIYLYFGIFIVVTCDLYS